VQAAVAGAPAGELPTALDITSEAGGGINGGRFPERPGDALQWDFVVRMSEGKVALLPARGLGIASRSAITPPITGTTFEGLREAPGQSTFVLDSAIVMEVGNVYVAR